MKSNSPEVTVCIDAPLEIGENPVWDDDRGVLWFVDIVAPAVYSFQPITKALARFDMPEMVGGIGLTHDQRLIVALKSGVHLFDPGSGAFEFLVNPEPDRPDNRPNDGKVGPDGCFWIGSMELNTSDNSGALYRVTPEGTSMRVLDGLFVSNGLAWSPDGRTMYHTDGHGPAIQAYDFDPVDGSISNQRTFASLDYLVTGWPDGGTTDADGNYWSAGVYQGKITQISPAGEVMRSIQMPVLPTTMPCLGGAQGQTLFVTSLRAEIDDVLHEGTLLSCEIDAKAGPVYKFGRITAR